MTTGVTTTSVTTTGGPVCGNGVLEMTEQCDGNDFGAASCVDFGYVNPVGLVCTQFCFTDASFCEPTCGNGVIEPDESCDDGNLIDNDGCSSLCTPEPTGCVAPIAVPLAMGAVTLTGSTAGGANNFQPQQANECSNGTGPDIVYEITPMESGFLTAYIPSANADFDSMLYFRSVCDQQASQILCNDNYNTPNNNAGGEVVSTLAVAGVPIYLVVDGWGGDSGSFDLQLDLSTGQDCNDPVPIVLEGAANIRAVGSTNGFTSEVTCLSGAGLGPDVVYQITVDAYANYQFNLNAGYNSVLNARTTCESVAAQIGCDNPGMTNDSSLNLSLNAMNTVNNAFFLWVDGTMGQSGTYSLFINQ